MKKIRFLGIDMMDKNGDWKLCSPNIKMKKKIENYLNKLYRK